MPTALLAAVFGALLVRVKELWFLSAPGRQSYAVWVTQSTVDGTAIAPNQYRLLVPWIEYGIATGLGVPLTPVMLLCDTGLAVAALVLLHRLAVRLGDTTLIIAAGALLAFWAMRLAHWHPEVMLLTVLVTAAAAMLLDEQPRCWPLVAIGVVMCGARTDYGASLGLALLSVGVMRCNPRLARAGGALLVFAVIATAILIRSFPDARYVTGVVQLGYNLSTPTSWLIVATTYAPVVGLLILAWRTDHAPPPLWPVVLWFAIQWSATLVVGRIDETRLLLPFAPVLGIAAGLAFRRLRQH